MDGGVGFGRIRISLLFRSVELKLPPPQLGWEVGTFEFTSDQITSTYTDKGKIKLRLRTGGSSGMIKREQCTIDGETMSWDISGDDKNVRPRLPVRHRYRSPIFFEFHSSGRRNVDVFAALWLSQIVDSDDQQFDIPIFRCNNGVRLSQNFITEENFESIPDLKLEVVGRLRFRGKFKAGTDRDHLRFVSDNDSRETIETWEACYAEGVREEEVSKELPPVIQKLHDDSLTQGRDVLANASEDEKRKWLAKDGTDWSGAFGKDPIQFMGGQPGDPEEDDEVEDMYEDDDSSHGDPMSPTRVRHEDTDLGIADGDTAGAAHDAQAGHRRNSSSQYGGSSNPRSSVDGGEGSEVTRMTTNRTNQTSSSGHSRKSSSSKNPVTAYKEYRNKSRDLHRQHRGLMQWRPMRNLQFAKDEAKYAVRRVTKLGALDGREPDVETEV